MYKTGLKVLLSSTLLLGSGLFAKESDNFTPLYTFSNVSVNYLDWSSSTENKTAHGDFSYLELEGGAGFKWGDFYGFFDIENPTKSYSDTSPDNLRYVAKPILNINLIDNFTFHIHDYYLKSKDFYVSNLITGISYKYSTSNFWIRPMIGTHY